MKRSIKTTFKYVAEVIVVAFGVFLGFYLDTLNSNKEHQKEKERTLNIIIKELETNKESTGEYVKHHKNLGEQLDALDSIFTANYLNSDYYENFGEFSNKLMRSKGLFSFARQSNSAFESGKISGIFRDFDINIIQEISSVYQMQDFYVEFGNSIRQKAVNFNSTSKMYDFITLIATLTNDGLGIEKELLTSQEELIQKLKQYQKE